MSKQEQVKRLRQHIADIDRSIRDADASLARARTMQGTPAFHNLLDASERLLDLRKQQAQILKNKLAIVEEHIV